MGSIFSIQNLGRARGHRPYNIQNLGRARGHRPYNIQNLGRALTGTAPTTFKTI